jgi:hypothetical protein
MPGLPVEFNSARNKGNRLKIGISRNCIQSFLIVSRTGNRLCAGVPFWNALDLLPSSKEREATEPKAFVPRNARKKLVGNLQVLWNQRAPDVSGTGILKGGEPMRGWVVGD